MKNRRTVYDVMNGQQSIPDAQGVKDPVSLLSNAAALLMEDLEDISWAGFYRLKRGVLYAGPFQGDMRILRCPVGISIAGTCAKEKKALLVSDVHQTENYSIDDEETQSAAAVPLERKGKLFAVLYLESHTAGRFTEEDRNGLLAFVKILSAQLG